MSTQTNYYNFEKLDTYVGGNKEVKIKLIEIFHRTAPELLKSINDSYQKNDLKNMSFFAHKLKSSIDIFNINDLKTDIRNLEKFGKEEINLDKIPALLEKLNKIIPKVVEQISSEIK
jgi:hypothetical protein